MDKIRHIWKTYESLRNLSLRKKRVLTNRKVAGHRFQPQAAPDDTNLLFPPSRENSTMLFFPCCAHWYSRKSRSFCPCQQLAREPPRNRDTNQRRERTPQPSKERKPGTNHRKPAQNKNRNRRKTQTPTADQPPEPQNWKPQHGTGRTPRRPSQSYSLSRA